jgi:hypothetical protein
VGKLALFHDPESTEEGRSPKAALGDVHTGYASASSARRWKAGVVSDSYSWWSSVAHCLDAEVVVTVIKNKLTPQLMSSLPVNHSVMHLFESSKTEVCNTVDSEEALLAHELNAILLDGRPISRGSKLWRMPNVKVIMSTAGEIGRRMADPPVGWRFDRVGVEHNLVGGVSDRRFGLFLWTRLRAEDTGLLPRRVPSQDLRSVMKTGVFGQDALPLIPSAQIGEEAIFITPNVVSVGGLYPELGRKPLVKIRTRFNDTKWCDRCPLFDELLLMWDVSESVTKGLDAEDKSNLESTVKVPM